MVSGTACSAVVTVWPPEHDDSLEQEWTQWNDTNVQPLWDDLCATKWCKPESVPDTISHVVRSPGQEEYPRHGGKNTRELSTLLQTVEQHEYDEDERAVVKERPLCQWCSGLQTNKCKCSSYGMNTSSCQLGWLSDIQGVYIYIYIYI